MTTKRSTKSRGKSRPKTAPRVAPALAVAPERFPGAVVEQTEYKPPGVHVGGAGGAGGKDRYEDAVASFNRSVQDQLRVAEDETSRRQQSLVENDAAEKSLWARFKAWLSS